MGAPSQTLIHNLTDRMAAIIRKDLGGFDAELVAASNLSLWALIDGSPDPAVVSALSAAADAVDRQSLPENYAAALGVVKNRPDLLGLARAIAAQVVSAPGGSYASFQAYLTAVGAVLHPLAAEVFRLALSEGAFSTGSDIAGVFAPNYQTKAPDRFYTGADGALVDDTTDAASAATADVALFGTNGHSVYIGSRSPFSSLVLALSTLGSSSITPTVSYWNGNAWIAVTGLVDNTAGLQHNDVISWALPAAGQWVRTYKDAGGNAFADKTPLYYLKITRTAGVLVTPPVGTCARIVPVPVLLSGTSHLGVDQPPLAIARISAADTIVVTPVATVDFNRFVEPGLRIRALTPIAGTVTLTLAYVDQAGANQSQVQAGFVTPAALDTAALALVGAGARSVRNTSTATTGGATEGVFEIYAAELRTPTL